MPTFVSVKQFGAKGDDSTDDWQAITNAINATPEGGVTLFPPGVYRVAQTVEARRNRTLLGTHAPKWFYRGGSPCSLKPHGTFASSSILRVADRLILGDSLDNDGGRIENLAIDGNSKNSGVVGLLFEGLVRDWTVIGVDVSQTSGDGFATIGYARPNPEGTKFPRGIYMDYVTAYSSGTSGSGAGRAFWFNYLTDGTIDHALAADSESHGMVFVGPGEYKLTNSRAAFCKGEGLWVSGAQTVGGFQVVNFSTDHNNRNGVLITATGTQPIHIVGLLARRDGANNLLGGGNFAAVQVTGTALNPAAPVQVVGLDSTVGQDDEHEGVFAPQWGVRAQYAQRLSVSGTAWGTSGGFSDAGNITSLDISNLYRRNGSTTGPPDVSVVGDQPTLAALANNGSGAPAPVLDAAATDRRGSLTFGSGTSPVVGSQVSVTFARPYLSTPVVQVAPGNGGSASRAPFATSVTTTGFNIAFNIVAAASQAATTYAVTYSVEP